MRLRSAPTLNAMSVSHDAIGIEQAVDVGHRLDVSAAPGHDELLAVFVHGVHADLEPGLDGFRDLADEAGSGARRGEVEGWAAGRGRERIDAGRDEIGRA